MATTSDRLLLWTPRVLGILLSAFIGVFALDALDSGPLRQVLPDFILHLVPALALLGLVIASFRRPLIGAVAFVTLACVYAATIPERHGDWLLVISGPLLIVGGLFLASWLTRGRFRA